MAQTIVGLFDTFDEARSVVSDLQNHGFDRNDISLVANDTSGDYSRTYGHHTDEKMDNTTAEQAGSGAVAGTAAGAGLGLLVGLAALAIPGVGPIIAAGPLAAALGAGAATVAGSAAIGAGLGAATGALVGPLVDAGIPRPEAEIYNEGVRRGGALVTVHTDDTSRARQAQDIMSRYNVVDIDKRGTEYRDSGWAYDSNAQNYSTEQVNDYRNARTTSKANTPMERAVGAGDYSSYDSDFRRHYDTNYANSGLDYNAYGPVYRYGYNLATDERFNSNDWNTVEADARARWEERNPGTWEQFKEGVHYAWDKVRGVR